MGRDPLLAEQTAYYRPLAAEYDSPSLPDPGEEELLAAAPEMLAIAAARIEDERLRFVEADLFSWRPERRYDVVFFGFWGAGGRA